MNNSRITLIYKKGDPLDALSYRPISISSALSKLAIKIIVKRLNRKLEQDSLLTPFQFGFREIKSTQDAHICLKACKDQALLEKLDMHMAFIDIRSAYDKVDREHLLRCCAEMGMDEFSIMIVRSFFKEDLVFFEIGGAKSDKLYL